MDGLERFALDLLQQTLQQLTADKRTELKAVAFKIHTEGLAVYTPAPDEPPPDIGMHSARRIEGWLKEHKAPKAVAARMLTVDEMLDRKAAEDAEKKAKKKEKAERLKEAREMADVFAQAQEDRGKGKELEQLYRRIDPSFVDYCRRQGMDNPREIEFRWQQQRQGAGGPGRFMYDPNEPMMSPSGRYW